MADDVEEAPNIGKVLGRKLRAAGILTASELLALGDAEAFRRLTRLFPEEACSHTRLALAGAVRGVRWRMLPRPLRDQILKEAAAAASAPPPARGPGDVA